MPGDEQEDVVMTGTQNTLLNTTCPLSGKPIIQLADPVRWYVDIIYFLLSNNDHECTTTLTCKHLLTTSI